MADNKVPRGEEIEIVVPPEIQAQLDADPKKAEFVREMSAKIRQALDGVATGKFADADEAMRSIGAEKVNKSEHPFGFDVDALDDDEDNDG
jgi:hypothetical protein